MGRASSAAVLPADLRPATDTSSAPELLRRLAAGTADVVGDAFLRALVRHIAEAFEADVAFVAEHVDGRAHAIAAWHHGLDVPPSLEYRLDGTVPCTTVARDGILRIPTGLTDRYPDARPAVDLGLDSYLGLALRGADTEIIGHLAVLSRRALRCEGAEAASLRLSTARPAAELPPRRHMALLRTRDAEVAAAR